MPQSNDSKQLKVGDTFNPYRVFFGIFIPEAMVSYHEISTEAKLCYGVLCRFAGQNGHCFPGQEKLSEILGVCDRQTRRYLDELIADGWIRSARRGLGLTNTYEFLWHPAFADRKETSSRSGNDSSGLSRNGPSSLSGQDTSGPLNEEENQSKRIKLRESEYRASSEGFTPLKTQTPETPENQNEIARAQGAQGNVQRLDTACLYLDDPIDTFIHDAGRREHRLNYKLSRRQDQPLVQTLLKKDSPQFRAAFLEYLKSSDEWLAQEGWPIRHFVKFWALYDRSLDGVPDHVALAQETGLGSIDGPSEVSEHLQGVTNAPVVDLEVLSWRPHQFAEYWNSLDALPKIKWHDFYDRQAGVKAFADDEFRKNFKAACAIAVNLHTVRSTEVGWLGFRWLLKYPSEGVANWWKLISGEFAWMLKTSGRPKTGDQVAAELRQLLDQEEKARQEEEKARNANHP